MLGCAGENRFHRKPDVIVHAPEGLNAINERLDGVAASYGVRGG